MKSAIRLFPVLAMLASPACSKADWSDRLIAPEFRGNPEAHYAVPAPIREESDEEPHTLGLAADGSFLLDGQELSPDAIRDQLGDGVHAPMLSLLLEIPAQARMDKVLPLFLLIEARGYYDVPIADLDSFATFDAGMHAGDQPATGASFQGALGTNELPIVVSHDSRTDDCIVTMRGQLVTSDELYDGAFMFLDEIVQRAGGADVVIADADLLDSILATVQSRPDTPWRCVAGAVHNVGKAGWPEIRFELVDGD